MRIEEIIDSITMETITDITMGKEDSIIIEMEIK